MPALKTAEADAVPLPRAPQATSAAAAARSILRGEPPAAAAATVSAASIAAADSLSHGSCDSR
jgi:hypothetical protein